MEYSINKLSSMAGISARTLRYYDEIGLLAPARLTEAGYRVYGPAEVDALQQILFYRALGVDVALQTSCGKFAHNLQKRKAFKGFLQTI